MLRHRPDEFGLNMNDFGFIPLDEVVEAVQQRYDEVTIEDIEGLVGESQQKRFEIADDAIRALYGHSFFVEMDGEPMEAPEFLYMGSTAAAARKMQKEGMRPVDRFYLHLSLTREVAESRSRQVGTPCVVQVKAQEAWKQGEIEFFSRGEVVLSREIPSDYVGEVYGLEGGEEPPEGRAERPPQRRAERGTTSREERPPQRRAERPATAPERQPPRQDEEDKPLTYGRKPRKATGRR